MRYEAKNIDNEAVGTYRKDGIDIDRRDIEILEERGGSLCGSKVLPVVHPIVIFEAAPELDSGRSSQGVGDERGHYCVSIPRAMKIR